MIEVKALLALVFISFFLFVGCNVSIDASGFRELCDEKNMTYFKTTMIPKRVVCQDGSGELHEYPVSLSVKVNP